MASLVSLVDAPPTFTGQGVQRVDYSVCNPRSRQKQVVISGQTYDSTRPASTSCLAGCTDTTTHFPASVDGRPKQCSLCECTLCASCLLNVTRWELPTLGKTANDRRGSGGGVGGGTAEMTDAVPQQMSPLIVESFETRTDPSFYFAYNPVDTDMDKTRTSHLLEPLLTRALHESASRCCARPGGLVVDVGGNFGWYTLYSLALGCHVVTVEPVAEFRQVMQHGLALNRGFAKRVALLNNVVFSTKGNFTVLAAVGAARNRKAMMGMASMEGPSGLLKDVTTASPSAILKRSAAAAVAVDDLINPQWLSERFGAEWSRTSLHTCFFKVDVEGYEPQVLRSARRMLSKQSVLAIQLELTHAILGKKAKVSLPFPPICHTPYLSPPPPYVTHRICRH